MAHLQKLIAQHGSTLLEQSGHHEVPAAQELEQMDELQAWLEGLDTFGSPRFFFISFVLVLVVLTSLFFFSLLLQCFHTKRRPC